MKAFIMNWNWLQWTKDQAEYLSDCGHEVIIVDNGSSYRPLLDWYRTCPYKVISTTGTTLTTYNRFVWEMKLPDQFTDNYYIVTDSDLDLSQVPKDFAGVLIGDIERNDGIIKSGLSLKIDDLPDNEYAKRYKEGEKNNFSIQDPYGFYSTPVDTTLAVYSKERCNNLDRLWRSQGDSVPDSFLDNRYFFRSHRSPSPYMARHLPWYLDINNLTFEQRYHISVAAHGSVAYFRHIYNDQLNGISKSGLAGQVR